MKMYWIVCGTPGEAARQKVVHACFRHKACRWSRCAVAICLFFLQVARLQTPQPLRLMLRDAESEGHTRERPPRHARISEVCFRVPEV